MCVAMHSLAERPKSCDDTELTEAAEKLGDS
jgi:hypothetical protein